jgi:hypothetical protein
MSVQPFNPANAFRFDLGRGQISTPGAGPRVLLPVDSIGHLLGSLGEDARRDFGQSLGTELGRRAAERLGDVRNASPNDVVDHLGGEWALMGLGSLGIELWGRALVFTVTGSPFGANGDEFIAAVAQGAVGRAMGRHAVVIPIHRDGDQVRLLAASMRASERARELLGQGRGYGEILEDINRSAETL